MRRILTPALLAAPLLLAIPGPARANDGPCTFGLGCPGGVCLNMFSRIHQHGPLYNYGPYCGYPPFSPYGPWDAYLHYQAQDAAVAGHHAKVKHGNPHPLCHGGLASLFHHGHKGAACDTCGGGIITPGTAPGAPTTAPTTAYSPYPVSPYQQPNPYAGYPGYGYGYNPYAAAAAGYYNPYAPQQVSYPPAGMPVR
jgi:hypothetical protein